MVTGVPCRVDPAGGGPMVGFGAKNEADRGNWVSRRFCCLLVASWGASLRIDGRGLVFFCLVSTSGAAARDVPVPDGRSSWASLDGGTPEPRCQREAADGSRERAAGTGRRWSASVQVRASVSFTEPLSPIATYR